MKHLDSMFVNIKAVNWTDVLWTVWKSAVRFFARCRFLTKSIFSSNRESYVTRLETANEQELVKQQELRGVLNAKERLAGTRRDNADLRSQIKAAGKK